MTAWLALRPLPREDWICPYCRDALGEAARACEACATRVHGECWDEHGGCPLLGCAPRPSAPAEAPRLGRVPRLRLAFAESLLPLGLGGVALLIGGLIAPGVVELGSEGWRIKDQGAIGAVGALSDLILVVLGLLMVALFLALGVGCLRDAAHRWRTLWTLPAEAEWEQVQLSVRRLDETEGFPLLVAFEIAGPRGIRAFQYQGPLPDWLRESLPLEKVGARLARGRMASSQEHEVLLLLFEERSVVLYVPPE